MTVGDRRMNQNAGGIDVRHDGHEIDGLMGRSLVHLQRIGQPAVIVAGVCHAADDRDGNLFNADLAVEAIDGTDQAGRIAGGQLQIVLTDALFIVRIAMEENIRDGVFLTALEDRLDAVLVVIVFLVLRTDAAGGGVEHNIDLLAQLVKAACDGNVLRFERGLVSAIDQIEVIFYTVRADHIALAQRLKRQRRRKIGNADQLHILLHRNTVRQPLSDGAIARNTNSDLSHIASHKLNIYWLSNN